jgi:catechol 2,3-dioxygenase-like lactoylglutathione lyase family enzyme
MTPVKLDHCVVHVSDWVRSNDFYARVLGAEVLERGAGFAYRFGDTQLNSPASTRSRSRATRCARATATCASSGRVRLRKRPRI